MSGRRARRLARASQDRLGDVGAYVLMKDFERSAPSRDQYSRFVEAKARQWTPPFEFYPNSAPQSGVPFSDESRPRGDAYEYALGRMARRLVQASFAGHVWLMRRLGIERDTLVIFTSDNGGERFSDNWPLVGGKMDLTEGGIRVPWVAHWPATIPAGSVSEQHAMTMDWSATLLALGGGQPHPDYPLDGVSLEALLRDPAQRFERPMHWRMNHRGQRALREGDWKYLMVDGHEYLFNIAADARERANRAPLEPQRLADMRQRWLDWDASLPPIPADATVSLGYGAKDMPQR